MSTVDKGDSKDLSMMVEEGVPMVEEADTKSDAGSSTTAPSVESGDSGAVAVNTNNTNNTAKSASNKRRFLLGGAALLIVGGVIAAVVVSTSSNNNNSKKNSLYQESISLGGDSEAPPMFGPFAAPFPDVELPLFNKDVFETYESRAALEADLTKATQSMVNKIILQNLQHFGHATYDQDGVAMEEIAMMSAQSVASASAKQAAQQKIKKAATNNQEDDADEADFLKTDGQYVYAAYGDYLVVWDMEGQMVTQEQMPGPEVGKGQDSFMTDDTLWHDPYFSGMSNSYVETIQVTDNHVVVIVGGLGEYENTDVGYGTKGTHVRVYNKPTETSPTLELVATRDISGYFFDSKYLEATNTIHIVSGGDFDSYTMLVGPLALDYALSPAEYYEAAVRRAQEELIPQYVSKMADFFIQGNEGQLPSIMKVNSWRTEPKQDEATLHPEDHLYGEFNEPTRAYLLVSSIPVDQIPTTISTSDTPLPLTTTALVGPSSWSHMYATKDSLVVYFATYEWNDETQMSEANMFLLHLKDNTAGDLTFHSYTKMDGMMAGKKAIDIQGNDLRIATTLQKWMPLDNVWPVCGDSWYFEDSCMNEENWDTCFDIAMDCQNVVKTGCPYTFECTDEPQEEEVSSTDNFITVFDISQPGEMMERGRVRIGDPHEVILGVHFGETFSYANTFDQRDPFYVLKLEEGKAPVVSGELKLEGFSSYLQPISEDGSLVVGIGQNVSGEGTMDQVNTGLLVSVFDVSDPAAPKVLASDMLANPKDEDSFSDAEWDHRAVQYSDGILVIPLQLYKKYHDNVMGEWEANMNVDEEWIEATTAPLDGVSDNFQGFIALDVSNVSEQGIKEVARISHSSMSSEDNCQYCSGRGGDYSRSFLFADKSLMTVRNSAVKSTDLTTGAELWSTSVSIDGEEMNCCH